MTVALFAALFATASSQAEWELGPTGVKASLRGLHACDDKALWACGSASTVIRSTDGGSSWQECGPDGYSEVEFRAIHAWNGDQAIIASAGTPAIILRTEDGGGTWHKVYENTSELAFFDGLRFFTPEQGLAFSDPVDGHLLIVETFDGGASWKEIGGGQVEKSLPGEAGFAASNSGLVFDSRGNAWIGTGGADSQSSRVHFRAAGNKRWETQSCPLVSGPAMGIFSIANLESGTMQKLVAVGGDYRPEQNSETIACFSVDLGTNWSPVERPPRAYRSSVVAFKLPATGRQAGPEDGDNVWLCAGPTGTDFSRDGTNWSAFSDRGFHVLAVGRTMVFAAGADGRFGVVKKELLNKLLHLKE